MSGPAPSERLYWKDGDQYGPREVSKLREIATRIEDGNMIQAEDVEDSGRIAELLRAKADKIEAAIRQIDRETHSDFDDLMKAIQYNLSGDYGASQVNEAWNEYGEA